MQITDPRIEAYLSRVLRMLGRARHDQPTRLGPLQHLAPSPSRPQARSRAGLRAHRRIGSRAGDEVPSGTIVKRDAVSVSIAAAAIVAKVIRDRIIDRLHLQYPEYGFDQNRGYGKPDHFEALDRLGPTPVHRLTKRTSR